jgi:hypothetical protein
MVRGSNSTPAWSRSMPPRRNSRTRRTLADIRYRYRLDSRLTAFEWVLRRCGRGFSGASCRRKDGLPHRSQVSVSAGGSAYGRRGLAQKNASGHRSFCGACLGDPLAKITGPWPRKPLITGHRSPIGTHFYRYSLLSVLTSIGTHFYRYSLLCRDPRGYVDFTAGCGPLGPALPPSGPARVHLACARLVAGWTGQ